MIMTNVRQLIVVPCDPEEDLRALGIVAPSSEQKDGYFAAWCEALEIVAELLDVEATPLRIRPGMKWPEEDRDEADTVWRYACKLIHCTEGGKDWYAVK